MKKKVLLGINVDHVATLRQVRGGLTTYPDIYKMVLAAVKGGADQITIHLREDRRHIQDKDLKLLARRCPVTLNLEMAATDEMVRIARREKPQWCCIVPEKRQELTTEGGLDVAGDIKRFDRIVDGLHKAGIKVSMFINPEIKQIEASARVGADAVELHTGKWVLVKGAARQKEWKKMFASAQRANELSLEVHAGHGLDYQTTKEIMKLPYLEELNIGHSIICYAIEEGLTKVVRKMKKIIKKR